MRSARSALITGGTGSVGQAVVASFSERCESVVFTYASDRAEAERLSVRYGARAARLDFISGIDEIAEYSFDIIVNCVGINMSSSEIIDIPESDWSRTFLVNFDGPRRVIVSALPYMVSQSWGRIVNIGSIYSRVGSILNGPYNSSKHALSGLTKSVAREYAGRDITCNEVLPGAIESDLMNEIARKKSEMHGVSAAGYLEQVRASAPDGRMASPSDIAQVVCFLASDGATHITGTSVTVDGGLTC